MTKDLTSNVSHSVRVSVIMPFFNMERFIDESIQSVLAQTYTDWELLLVDDGSTDSSTDIARRYARDYPERVRYFEHEDHQNRGASASRNLAIANARGEYLAPLDADDLWLPNKLQEQVPLLDARPEVGMVTGRTLVWYSWTQEPRDAKRDHILPLGIAPNTLVPPPKMLADLLKAKVRTPCPCSILLRKAVVEDVGGFEDSFRFVFTDQVLYAKLFLSTPIFIADGCWDKYRQHSNSSGAIATRTGRSEPAELAYLDWLEGYLADRDMQEGDVGEALRSYRWWRWRHPWLYRARGVGLRAGRALQRIAKNILPRSITDTK